MKKESKELQRWKVYIKGEKEPLILTGKDKNSVKKFAHQMIKNNKVKIAKVVKEGFAGNLKGKKKEAIANKNPIWGPTEIIYNGFAKWSHLNILIKSDIIFIKDLLSNFGIIKSIGFSSEGKI